MISKESEAAGPSGPGTVVLELGPGVGALVLTAPAELTGAEIDVGLTGSDGRRTHSAVRPRHVAGGTHYAAVYPNLPPGEYAIWRSEDMPVMTVSITGGVVTTAHLHPRPAIAAGEEEW